MCRSLQQCSVQSSARDAQGGWLQLLLQVPQPQGHQIMSGSPPAVAVTSEVWDRKLRSFTSLLLLSIQNFCHVKRIEGVDWSYLTLSILISNLSSLEVNRRERESMKW